MILSELKLLGQSLDQDEALQDIEVEGLADLDSEDDLDLEVLIEEAIEDDLDLDEAREVLVSVETELHVLKAIELQDLEVLIEEAIEDDAPRDQVPNLLCKISFLRLNQKEETIEEENNLEIH